LKQSVGSPLTHSGSFNLKISHRKANKIIIGPLAQPIASIADKDLKNGTSRTTAPLL
jgi:hypothetical protein